MNNPFELLDYVVPVDVPLRWYVVAVLRYHRRKHTHMDKHVHVRSLGTPTTHDAAHTQPEEQTQHND